MPGVCRRPSVVSLKREREQLSVVFHCVSQKHIMAPVYDFRHVELDKIGRGKRIVKPPGGECSDIFNVQGGSPEKYIQVTPKKSNNYMQSSIFSPSPGSPQNGHSNASTPTSSAKKHDDTQNRLFGASDETPKKIVDRQRSTIFADENDGMFSPKSSPGRPNPIAGGPQANGTPKTNGHVNGNGTPNGHCTPETPTNGSGRVRVPPGGPSSGIF